MNKEKLRAYLEKDYAFKKELLERIKKLRDRACLDESLYTEYSKEIYLTEGKLVYNSNILSKLDAGDYE